jgi:hypothetical protein
MRNRILIAIACLIFASVAFFLILNPAYGGGKNEAINNGISIEQAHSIASDFKEALDEKDWVTINNLSCKGEFQSLTMMNELKQSPLNDALINAFYADYKENVVFPYGVDSYAIGKRCIYSPAWSDYTEHNCFLIMNVGDKVCVEYYLVGYDFGF